MSRSSLESTTGTEAAGTLKDLAALEEAVVARAVETLTLRPRGQPRRSAPELEAVAEMGGREPLADITRLSLKSGPDRTNGPEKTNLRTERRTRYKLIYGPDQGTRKD
uniref:Uncharacterized protein n=1 Tax=Amphimedon queenslandica TaxID=400682 RepID=A0A1X7SUL6_AMPQE